MTRYGAIAAAQLLLSPINRTSSQLGKTACLVLGLFALTSAGGNGLLLAEERPGLGCISEMALPVYAGVFWQAQITGTAIVRIVLGPKGTPSDVQVVESPHAFLKNWLPEWFKKSSFLPGCGGQTIQITLKYRLDGARRESPDNHIVIRFPGTFEITAYPPILHQTID
jgi:hypothetical protein